MSDPKDMPLDDICDEMRELGYNPELMGRVGGVASLCWMHIEDEATMRTDFIGQLQEESLEAFHERALCRARQRAVILRKGSEE